MAISWFNGVYISRSSQGLVINSGGSGTTNSGISGAAVNRGTMEPDTHISGASVNNGAMKSGSQMSGAAVNDGTMESGSTLSGAARNNNLMQSNSQMSGKCINNGQLIRTTVAGTCRIEEGSRIENSSLAGSCIISERANVVGCTLTNCQVGVDVYVEGEILNRKWLDMIDGRLVISWPADEIEEPRATGWSSTSGINVSGNAVVQFGDSYYHGW